MKGDRRVADVTHRVRIGPSSSLGPSHGMESLLSTQPVGRGTGPGTRGAPRDRDRRVHRARCGAPVSYTHLRAHETPEHLVCRLLLEKKKTTKHNILIT